MQYTIESGVKMQYSIPLFCNKELTVMTRDERVNSKKIGPKQIN